jgi:hypothetical protein
MELSRSNLSYNCKLLAGIFWECDMKHYSIIIRRWAIRMLLLSMVWHHFHIPRHCRRCYACFLNCAHSFPDSTVQLHDSLCSRRACSFSDAVLVVTMATVLECITEEQRFVVRFFRGHKASMQRILIKMLSVYGGKCSSRKAVHSWVANVSLMASRLKRRCGNGWDNSRKTCMLRVSTHWFYIHLCDGYVEVHLLHSVSVSVMVSMV